MKRGALAHALPTAASIGVLVCGMAAINDDVREYVSQIFHGAAAAELSSIGWRAQDIGRLVVNTVKDQSYEHGPLMIFVVAAGALVLVMLRT